MFGEFRFEWSEVRRKLAGDFWPRLPRGAAGGFRIDDYERKRHLKNNRQSTRQQRYQMELVLVYLISVQPRCSLCLRSGQSLTKNHHRDTENTEVAQRKLTLDDSLLFADYCLLHTPVDLTKFSNLAHHKSGDLDICPRLVLHRQVG